MPRHPGELAQHDVLAYSLFSMGDSWQFNRPSGQATVKVNPRMCTNNGDTCRAAVLEHKGNVLQPTFLVGEDIQRGTLVEVLPEFRCVDLGDLRRLPYAQVRLAEGPDLDRLPVWPD